jgi:hypothetical protein
MPSPPPTRDAPERLDADMTLSDIIEISKRLPFRRGTARGRATRPTHCVVALDRDVRDYLVSAVTARRGKRIGENMPLYPLSRAHRHRFVLQRREVS